MVAWLHPSRFFVFCVRTCLICQCVGPGAGTLSGSLGLRRDPCALVRAQPRRAKRDGSFFDRSGACIGNVSGNFEKHSLFLYR